MAIIHHKDYILLLGFNAELKELRLSDEVLIRKGTEQELNEFYKRIKYDNVKNQTFVIEYEYLEENISTYPRKFLKLIDDLNIFFLLFFENKTKVAYGLRQIMIDGEYKSSGFTTNTKVSTYFSDEYNLKSEDSEKIKEYWHKFQLQFENHTMRIALSRLLRSIEMREQEDQIIDLMIAFEALLIKSHENLISQKIADRCSKLVTNKYDCTKVFNFLREIYKLRSEIVHGSSPEFLEMNSKEKYLYLDGITSKLSELLSHCIQRKIIEFTSLDSREFITKLDNNDHEIR